MLDAAQALTCRDIAAGWPRRYLASHISKMYDLTMSRKTSSEAYGQSEDVVAIRALAHPLRLRILDLIQDRGVMTATQVSEIVGESPANCAFHLRTLGRYGYIEEAGGGKGRERPWRHRDHSISLDDAGTDGESTAAAVGYRTARQMQRRVRRAAWEAQADRAPARWRQAEFDMEFTAKLTAAELRTVEEAIREAVTRVIDSRVRGAPDGAALVQITANGFPFGSFADKDESS